MKILLIVTCACLFFVACARPVSANGADDLSVGIALTTGEWSKDSSSETTTITVERDTIVWQQTSSRDRRSGKPPLQKEFKLSPTDKENLLKLIRSNNLLVTESVELPQDNPVTYFRISVTLTLEAKKGSINISGPRTAVKVKEERLYQNTLTLVKELYRIMNSQDRQVLFEELILEPYRERLDHPL